MIKIGPYQHLIGMLTVYCVFHSVDSGYQTDAKCNFEIVVFFFILDKCNDICWNFPIQLLLFYFYANLELDYYWGGWWMVSKCIITHYTHWKWLTLFMSHTFTLKKFWSIFFIRYLFKFGASLHFTSRSINLVCSSVCFSYAFSWIVDSNEYRKIKDQRAL